MRKVDGLSRRPDWKDKNQTLIKKQWIYSLAEVVIDRPEVDIIEKMLRRDK